MKNDSSSRQNYRRIRALVLAKFVANGEMASELKLNGNELLEVDICDGGVFSEDESGVFVNSAASLQEDFSGFQQWTSTAESPNDTSSPPGQQEVPSEHGAPPGTGTATQRANSTGDSDSELQGDGLKAPRTSIVDCLLVELYETYSGGSRRNVDSWDSSTEASGSDAFLGRSNSGSSFLQELQEKHTRRHQMNYLAQKAPEELHAIIQEVKYRTGLQSAKLIRQLKRRDRLHHKLQKNYDIITACLQAVSQKRRVDTRLKFTIEPSLGKNGFQQWYDALKAVARLPTGIPKEWRKRVWLTLADQYLHSISIDWEKTLRFAFNERSNPDDDSLGIQIVKDLHRTGCSSYCGQEGEQDRVVLKRVLLAYARWNKAVGYCQGFNVLAALILEVTEGNESDALKVMIYLIDKVLPESYFANNLRALSVDMAVFRDLLRLKLPRLSQHLHHLQKAANREAGGSYEPPLTNVFTMQWFLTMFATCLPASTVLKIWDSVFFEGSEVLFRVALAIWERLGERIEYCQTADEFYSTMGCLTQEMLEHNLIDPTELMQEVYSMAVFPFPQLAELREKYTYNITPFPTSVKSNGSGGLGSWESDDDADMDDEDSVVTALGCLGPLGGLLAPELQRYQKHLKDQRAEQGNIAELSPGAVGAGGAGGGVGGGARAEHQAAINSMMMERMSTDIYALKKQYTRIKRRQQQQAMQLYIRTDKCPATRVLASQLNPSSSVINHLLLGRKPRGSPWGSRPTSTSTSTLPGARPAFQSQSEGSPARQRCGSLPSNSSGSPGSSGGGTGSPWRAHVRVHRRNIARARAQLGFEDSEEREDDKEEEGRSVRLEGEEETKIEETKREDEKQEEGSDTSVSPPRDLSFTGSVCEEAPQVVDETKEAEIAEVVVQLDSLDLEDESNLTSPISTNPETRPTLPESKPAPQVPPLPPPPSSNRHKESESSGSGSSDRHFPSIVLPPPHHSSNSGIPSSSPSTPSPPPSAVPTLPSLGPSCSSSPRPPSTPTPSSTFHLPSSSSVNSLSALSLPASSAFYKTSCPSTPSLSSVSSSSKSRISASPSTPAFSSTTSTPKQHVFSPFPCVKQPRKSAAARNLGLYGPTSRTPTVHFPQLSRNLNRSSAAGTTGSR
ncbi:TBC1 domain family member 30 isoform X2 [Toxotes jaculatrix]|uniref:TBC1 domain family member 30 isoform X2 n=1 Tax=Toxotes jaculatrix TaxID=941984 RepID=UPI001B3AF37A|nr:TBC1 domain family member 30 isoform X2 [Toxotes jaculatrix]